MSARIPCCVPFCRRTAPAGGTDSEIICGPHWRAVDRAKRAEYAKVRRRALASPGVEQMDEYYLAWESIKRVAIEGALAP